MRRHNKHIWGLSFPLTSLNSVTWFEGQSHMTDCIVTLELTYGIQRTWIKKYKPKRKASWKDLGKKRRELCSFLYVHTCTPGLDWMWKHPQWFLVLNSEPKTISNTFPSVCCGTPITPGTPLFSIQINMQISLYTHSDISQSWKKEKSNWNLTRQKPARLWFYRTLQYNIYQRIILKFMVCFYSF